MRAKNKNLIKQIKSRIKLLIINLDLLMKNNENLATRKKLEDYSYSLSHNIGKGYSSQVYRGRNDITSTFNII